MAATAYPAHGAPGATAAHGRSARVDPGAPPEAALDLHEGISHPDPLALVGGCPRWPTNLRLQSSHGDLVPGRCKSTNLCEYCARLAAVETSEVLTIDAMTNSAPAVWLVLTTRSTSDDPRPFYDSRRLVMRALKRRWPDAEYAAQVEFTTGYGTRSGGARRPHWNVMLKGIQPDDLDQVRDVVTAIWCAREDAEPDAQHVGALYSAPGALRYIAQHFQKSAQAPPHGWRGHRFLKSRGYFATPLPQLRWEARQALSLRRHLWRLRDVPDHELPADLRDEFARTMLEVQNRKSWDLVDVAALPSSFGPDGLPATSSLVVVGHVADRRSV